MLVKQFHEELRPESIAKNKLLQNKRYEDFLNKMGKDQKMSNQEAFQILGLPDIQKDYLSVQANEAEDTDLDEFWQPLEE